MAWTNHSPKEQADKGRRRNLGADRAAQAERVRFSHAARKRNYEVRKVAHIGRVETLVHAIAYAADVASDYLRTSRDAHALVLRWAVARLASAEGISNPTIGHVLGKRPDVIWHALIRAESEATARTERGHYLLRVESVARTLLARHPGRAWGPYVPIPARYAVAPPPPSARIFTGRLSAGRTPRDRISVHSGGWIKNGEIYCKP